MNRQPPRSLYSFPELKAVEILQCMVDLNIQLSDTELIKPTPAAVQRVYEAFAEIFMGSSKDQYVANESSEAVAAVEYSEIYLDAISLVRFFRIIVRLMREVGIEDFGMRDLIKPEPHRLKIILSAVINFAKFREEQLNIYEELNKKTDEIYSEKDRLLARHQELSNKIAVWKRQLQDEEPRVQNVREHNNQMIQELRELKKEQTTLTATIEELKAQRTSYSERLAHAQFLLNNSRQDCNKLKSRIVHSPEKLFQIINELGNAIASEKTNVAQLEKRSRDMQVRLDSIIKVEEDLKKCGETLNDLEDLLRTRDNLSRQIKDLADSSSKCQSSLRDKENRLEQVNRQLATANEKLTKLHSQQQSKREQVQSRLKELREEYGQLSEERSKVMLKIDQTDKMIKEMDVKISDLKRSHDAEIFNLRADCLNLKSQVSSYANEVRKFI